jgi:hypothetical protein
MNADVAPTIPPIAKIYTSGVIAQQKLAANVPKLGISNVRGLVLKPFVMPDQDYNGIIRTYIQLHISILTIRNTKKEP